MEVHPHSHTHGKKSWKTYIWEFLMLFLAVFCGFLAENFREHQVEHRREKEYMQSMVQDLKADTASISILIPTLTEKNKTYDSLTNSVFEKKYLKDGSDFYYWARIISRSYKFTSNDGTIQQLKNSDGFRLIHNKSVTDSIISYDIYYRGLLNNQLLADDLLTDYRNIASKVFDAEIFNRMFITVIGNDYSRNGYIFYMRKPEGNPQIRKNADEFLNELMNRAMYWHAAAVSLINDYRVLNKKAEHLILLIQKEYHLE